MARPAAAATRAGWLIAAAMALGFAAPAVANPLMLPTVYYTADVEITRPSDFSMRHPARLVYGGQRIRVDFGSLSTLVNFDRRETTIMMPRVRTYWWPQKIPDPLADGRRWIGVEAESAEVVGQDSILGQPVTRYRVRGKIFETRTPFEGDVWTTRENIVVQIDGIGKGEDGQPAPVKLRTIQLVIAAPDPWVLSVPSTFARARKSDTSWRDGD
jgi:hypothetical protein